MAAAVGVRSRARAGTAGRRDRNFAPGARTRREGTSPERDTMGRTGCGDSMNTKMESKGKTQSDTSQGDDFQWDSYLKKTGSTCAPVECFRQSKVPPTNEFRVGMKLEAHDPRNMNSTCIATIIGVIGSRLRLRLDGSDDKNDFWRLVDSPDIQPVGTCEQQGDLLQPPLGYKISISSWSMFLLRTLDGSEMAPATFFKEVQLQSYSSRPMPALKGGYKGSLINPLSRLQSFESVCRGTSSWHQLNRESTHQEIHLSPNYWEADIRKHFKGSW